MAGIKRRASVTMRDVARAAGVSVATVSYHVNGSARLSPATRGRVEKAVASLGYRPDPLARSLSLGRRDAVGLAAFIGSGPFIDLIFSPILAGAAEPAAATGRTIQLIPILENGSCAEWPARLLDVVDGTLILDWAASRAPWGEIRRRRHPVVLMNASMKGVVSVEVDQEGGGRLAASHLAGLGHKRVAVFTAAGPLEKRRAQGALRTFERCGVRAEVVSVNSSTEKARATLRALAARRSAARPTAVFCVSDWIALSVIQEAGRIGLRVPEDLSVVGFDDAALAAHAQPPLTTVRQPLREMGRVSVETLEAMLRGEKRTSCVLSVELVVRESTAPPSRRPGTGAGAPRPRRRPAAARGEKP